MVLEHLMLHDTQISTFTLSLKEDRRSCFWCRIINTATSFQSLCLCPACSCSYHISSLCQLTTLTIHNSLFLSLPPQDLPLSQNNLSHHRLPSSLRTDSADFTTGPFLLSISVFLFLVSSLFFFVWFRAAD